MAALAHSVAAPEVGKLVEVRGHRWVVVEVDRFAATLRKALDDAGDPQSEYTQMTLDIGDEREFAQYRETDPTTRGEGS